MPLKVVVPGGEFFDSKTEEFITVKPATLIMEHSLLSISKWEEKWHVPFIKGPDPRSDEKTNEMWLDYFRCMVISPKSVDMKTLSAIPLKEQKRIAKYIEASNTASSVSDIGETKGRKEQITSELIYYWMIAYQIPVEFEKWHLSRLIMLIRICQRKNEPPKKQSQAERSLNYARISAKRRKAAAARKKK